MPGKQDSPRGRQDNAWVIGHDEPCPYGIGRHKWRPYFARTREAVK